MARSDVTVSDEPAAPLEAQQRRAPSRLAWWLEQLVPRACGLVFLYAGVAKAWDGSRTHRVFAFDGVPEPLIAPLTHVVWLGEVVLGLALLIGVGVATRRAVVAAILVLFVYSLQLGYLIVRDNPPKDCACLAIFAQYASAKQQLVLGLVRNALMAGGLEWVRLRMAGRALARMRAGATQEDG
jgi:uncharacterized membrane protein YphA (DoxX/SURF4 family)